MRTISTNIATRVSKRAFTLVELMVATTVGIGLAGIVVLLLVQSAAESRNGFADTTVEEKAYTLQANITSTLRSMSASMGFNPNYASSPLDTNGNPLINEFQTITVFYPTNGGYIDATISFNPSTGTVIFTPNDAFPAKQVVWMTNSATARLTKFYLAGSQNLDSSQNNSLVNVVFAMNDNGFSQQPANNNPANLYRTFSVQMRNDN
jgi:type II secretory pathway pseudopilin PulG